MRLDVATFDALGVCFEYPSSNVIQEARKVAARLNELDAPHRALAETLQMLVNYVASAREGEPEERYTILFDLKPVCTLNLGHHLFGDTYQRGALLAGLAASLSEVGINSATDLPDHLPTLLRLLGRLEDAEDRRLLVHTIMLPALSKVASALAETTAPWPKMLDALTEVLSEEVPKGDHEVPVIRKPLEVLQQCSM